MKSALSVAFILIISLFGQITHAQESNKLDLYTRRMLHAKDFKRTSINLFVKGEQGAIAAAAERAGGHLKYAYGNIAAVNIPIKGLDKFLADDAVLVVENGDIPVQRMCDTAILTNNVLPVLTGQAPLAQPYNGEGVVVGIIDNGIDINHGDFKTAGGKTRIKYIWDQLVANNNSPAPYNYGREWTELDINAGTCTHVEPTAAFSHGTHVSGIAVGNGLAANAFPGMAPNADIIEVSLNEATNFLSNVVDACDYVFKKADAMGKPCVINASVGTYVGSRDGKDMAAQLIDAMLEQRRGRSLVCALGNAGQIKMHLGYEVTADTSFTWFKLNSTSNDVYFEAYANTADFDSVYYSVAADDIATNTYVGNIGYHTLRGDYNLSGRDTVTYKNFVLYSGTTFIATCSTQVTVSSGVYKLAIYLQPQNSSYLWRFVTTGHGRFDLWSAKAQMGFSDMVATAPDSTLNPTYAHYMLPDTLETLVSSFTCSDKVISVGNFVNRSTYIDYARDTIYDGFTPGTLFKDDNTDPSVRLGSSYGPTRDRRLKPDISAPGGVVVASGNAAFIAAALGSGQLVNTRKIAITGKHFRNSGTSMASPMVAGAVALYLQANPNASYREIKEAFVSTAFKDSFTTQTPNIAYGNGKLDCFAAMQTNIHYGCTDTAAINYDGTANHNDGSCISKVYGCMDVDADNYDSLANIVDTCIYPTVIGIGTTKKIDPIVSVSPNPSTGNATLNYYISPEMVGTAHIMMTDLLGKVVYDFKLEQIQGAINFHNTTKGVYLYYLQAGDKLYSRKKLVVY